MRYATIDLSSSPPKCDDVVLGVKGEHCANTLRVFTTKDYSEMMFYFDFKLADGSKFSSKAVDYSEVIIYNLKSFLLKGDSLTVDLVAFGKGKTIKPFSKTFVVNSAINGADEISEEGSMLEDIFERIKKITVINHLHDNLETLKSITKATWEKIISHVESNHAPSDAEKNVQSDWNETNEKSDSFIKNKPSKKELVSDVLAALPTWSGGVY